MDVDMDDACPPPIERIRRSPRAVLEYQEAHKEVLDEFRFDDCGFEEQEPPPVQPVRSASLDGESTSSTRPRATSTSSVNPLAAHPIGSGTDVNFSRRRPPNPFQKQSQSQPFPVPVFDLVSSVPTPPPIPRRSPARLRSYRPTARDKRLPPHLRQRRVSLETIDSVTTTQSDPSDDESDDEVLDPPEASAPSPDFFMQEYDPASTPIANGANSQASSIRSSSTTSRPSSNLAITPVDSRDSGPGPNSPKSIFRKLKPRKANEQPGIPDRLVIKRTVSFDRLSQPSSQSPSHSGSNLSLPPERPFESALFHVERSQSQSSSEWSASSFDITSLTEAEIKKCKKKGINPALYAEMKAARKGKWTSPIAGNTFL
jgi:hypothetical protein